MHNYSVAAVFVRGTDCSQPALIILNCCYHGYGILIISDSSILLITSVGPLLSIVLYTALTGLIAGRG